MEYLGSWNNRKGNKVFSQPEMDVVLAFEPLNSPTTVSKYYTQFGVRFILPIFWMVM